MGDKKCLTCNHSCLNEKGKLLCEISNTVIGLKGGIDGNDAEYCVNFEESKWLSETLNALSAMIPNRKRQ